MTARVAAILAFATPLAAAPELAVHSPFESSRAGSPEVIRREVLELRGIMPSADGIRYCIFDTLKNSSTWAAVSEPCGNFIISAADPAAEEVTLGKDGRSVTLRLRESKVTALTPEGIAPIHAIAYVPLSRRQPGEARAPRATGE